MDDRPRHPLRILVVDDEDTVRTLIQRALLLDRHQVRSVPSVAQAQALLGEGPFDVAVLDKNLGDGDGVRLAQSARLTHPGLGIVLVTGYTSEESVRALVGVADAYLSKPFHVRELREKVQEAGLRRAVAAESAGASQPPGFTGRRALVLEPDVRGCARLSRLLRSMNVAVEVAHSAEALEGPGSLQAAVISSRCLDAVVRRAVWRRQGASADFRLVVSSPERTVDDGILAIGAGARAHVAFSDGDGTLLYALGQALGITAPVRGAPAGPAGQASSEGAGPAQPVGSPGEAAPGARALPLA